MSPANDGPPSSRSPRADVSRGAVLVLLLTFFFGCLTGAGIALVARPPSPPPPPVNGALPLNGPLPLRELELTLEQRDQVARIFDAYHPRFDAVFRSTFPRVEALNLELEHEIRKILTTEQNAELDELKRRRPRHPPPPLHARPDGPHSFPPEPRP